MKHVLFTLIERPGIILLVVPESTPIKELIVVPPFTSIYLYER